MSNENAASRTRPAVALKVVLDTNVVISATLFRSGKLKSLRYAWQSGRLTPVISNQTSQELLRVLNYAKFRLGAAELESVLALYLPYVQTHTLDEHVAWLADLPTCRDPKDQMFLRLAQSARADFLVTGDADLLSLSEQQLKHTTFAVCTPAELLSKLID